MAAKGGDIAMIKTYKIRLLPTAEQEQKMWQHIGACRYIWNYMLALQKTRYENGEKHLSNFDMNNLLKPLKNDGEHDWMYEVSNTSLQKICADLSKAYQRLFKKAAMPPRFKSRKKAKPNFPVRETVYFKDGFVSIEKLGKLTYKTNYTIPQGREQKFSNPRVSFVNNKWILTVGVECENQVLELTDKPMGIDLGVKALAVVSFGDERLDFHNINKSKRVRTLERKLKRIQRAISRKYRTNGSWDKSNAIIKYEAIAKEVLYKLSNIRHNYVHQTTHSLVSKLPYRITMEDLNVRGMMKNRHLSKAIGQQCFGEFIRQMRYKCDWSGIEFVQAPVFYPSSKTCSSCGWIKPDLKLKDRTFICECGYVVDRDFNAAINLMKYADSHTRAAA
jgi:putative transposase